MTTFTKRASSSAIALAVVAGTATLTAPVALASPAAQPASSISTQQTASGPVIEFEKDAYTPEETREGFLFHVTGLEQGQQIESYLTLENGTQIELRDYWAGGGAGADGSATGWMKVIDQGVGQALEPGTYTIETTIVETGQVIEGTFTVSEDAPGFETPPVNDSEVSVDQESFTSEETAEGIFFVGDGFKNGEDYTVEVVFPDGSIKTAEQVSSSSFYVVGKDGHIQATVEKFTDGTEMPLEQSGTYTLRISQRNGEFTSETNFEVVGDDDGDSTPPVTGPNVTTEQESYTVEEAVNEGVNYMVSGFTAEAEYEVELVKPDGTSFAVGGLTIDGDGQAMDKLKNSAQGVDGILELEGTYTLRVTQTDDGTTAETTLTIASSDDGAAPIADDDNETTGSGEGKGDSNAGDSGLATTGADGNMLWLALGGGLILVTAGAGLMVVRSRKQAAE